MSYKPELLAPAGNVETLKAVIKAGADAVYLGGKSFNMRLHEGDLNFNESELKSAVDYAHRQNVRVYITINNLFSVKELPELQRYLDFLEKIEPDALIVQDLSLLSLAKTMDLSVPLHASVMLNTESVEAARFLASQGVTRIVAGRELSLAQTALIQAQTGLETEYFIHGDMCSSVNGQCRWSGILFGQSANRGRCFKPCRWPYELLDLRGKDISKQGPYKLAYKDMCLYKEISRLISYRINSFKIEGRMRPPAYLVPIVSAYRKAIDAHLANPMGAVDEVAYSTLEEHRIRDFTTSYALGIPHDAIGFSGKREPRFFSEAVEEAAFQDSILIKEPPITSPRKPRLAVRVADVNAAKIALECGADKIYFGGEIFWPQAPPSISDCKEVIKAAHAIKKQAAILTPRVMLEPEGDALESYLAKIAPLSPDAILVGTLGALELVKNSKIPSIGDVSLNIFNNVAAALLRDSGIKGCTASTELAFSQLRDLATYSPIPIEAIVHGPLTAMITHQNLLANEGIHTCQDFFLKDKAGGLHPVKQDQFGRQHIFMARDLCLYPYLDKFMGLDTLRIEAQFYDTKHLAQLVTAYRQRIDGNTQDQIKNLESSAPRPLGIATYRYRESRDSF